MPNHLSREIAKAYRIIGDATPVRGDCGQLCGAACCQGDDAGMLLFPGEAPRLSRVPGFRVTRISYMDSMQWLLCCDGTCDRALRPLSCRIFPLAPHVAADGSVTALPDPRGRPMCPLADGLHLDPAFRRRVGRVFTMLAETPRMLAFMRKISEEVDELRRFFP